MPAAQISTSAAQISTSSDDGGEPHDSVSIAGREGGKVNQAAADSTAKDTGAALVEVDSTVGILDVDNTGVEAVEPTAKNKVATRKTFSHLNEMAPKIIFSFNQIL